MKFKPDFLMIPYPIYSDANLNKNDHIVYAIVYWYEHLKDGVCFASNDSIAEVAMCSPSGVNNSLGRLEENGHVKRYYDGEKRRIETTFSFKKVKTTNSPELVPLTPQSSSTNSPESYISNSISNNDIENVKDVFPSEEDIVLSPTDGDGEELLPRTPKKPKGERKNEIAMRVQKKFADMCEKAVGVRPIINAKGYLAALYAMNTGGLTEKQIYDLFDDWFGSDKADDLRMSINAALSARSINAFKLTI